MLANASPCSLDTRMHARAQDATACMKHLRPVTDPKGALQQLPVRYEEARSVVA